jgi:hypothetical protein
MAARLQQMLQVGGSLLPERCCLLVCAACVYVCVCVRARMCVCDSDEGGVAGGHGKRGTGDDAGRRPLRLLPRV